MADKGTGYTTGYTANDTNASDSVNDFTVQHQTTFNTSVRNVDDTIKKLDESLPTDDITELSGAPIGSPEYENYEKLIDNVGEINSTGRVNFVILGLRLVGILGIFLSIVIKIWSIQFDATYHLPTLVKVIGDSGLIIGSTLVAFVILFFSHAGADGLVNNKWLTSNKIVLASLFLIGITSSLFFDYRAVSNYTTAITEDAKVKHLQSNTTTLGVEMSKADSKEKALVGQENGITATLSKIRTRLQNIGDERSSINSEISTYKTDKQNTTNKKKIKTLNSNIYTSRKQLKELDKEEANLLSREENYNSQLDFMNTKKDKIAESKISTISVADIEAEEEKKIRLILMYVFLVFIEIASFGMTLADHVSNKNLTKDGITKANQIVKNSNQEVVLDRALNVILANQVKRAGQKVQMTGHIMDTFGATGVLQQASTAKMIGTTAGALMHANETAVKGQEALMEAQVVDLHGKLAVRKSSKLEELVRELIEKEEEFDYAKYYSANPRK